MQKSNRNYAGAAGRFLAYAAAGIVKAVVVWLITQAIQDMIRTSSLRVTMIPLWSIVLALVVPGLRAYLALYFLLSIAFAAFYRMIWGQNTNVIH